MLRINIIDMLDIFGKEFTDNCRVKMNGVTVLLNCREVNNDLYLFNTSNSDETTLKIKITEELVKSHNLEISPSFTIHADETLFLEMKSICNGFQTLTNIIQNNTTVDPIVIDQWKKVFDLNMQDLVDWRAKMEKHIGV